MQEIVSLFFILKSKSTTIYFLIKIRILMKIVRTNFENSLIYFSRYNQVDKWTILNHNSRIETSGLTYLVGDGGKIMHTGITYNFEQGCTFTYKAYYYDQTGSTYYLANTSYLQSYADDTRLNFFKEPVRVIRNQFKNKNSVDVNAQPTTTTTTTIYIAVPIQIINLTV